MGSNTLFRFGLLTALLQASTAWGQGTSSARFRNPSSPKIEPAKWQGEGKVSLGFDSYAATPGKVSSTGVEQLDFAGQMQWGTVTSKLDLQLRREAAFNATQISIQELSANTFANFQAPGSAAASRGSKDRPASSFGVSLGRVRSDWNHSDRNWGLGLWEPVSEADGLKTLRQGLTGLFVQRSARGFFFSAFASPWFVPTMSPGIAEKDGTLVPQSRWSKAPSDKGVIISQEKELVYDVNIPELLELVYNPGAAAKLGWGDPEPGGGFWAQFAAARKPINTLLIKYESKLGIGTASDQESRGQTELRPFVGMHNLFGVDAGYSTKQWELVFSGTQDRPNEVRPEQEIRGGITSDWIAQNPGNLDVFSVRLGWRGALPLGIEQAALSYLRVNEERTVDVNAAGDQVSDFFPHRVRYTNALRLDMDRGPLRFSYLREFDQQGSLWSLQHQWTLARKWQVFAFVDILGVDDDSQENLDSRFLNQFRANDRAGVGVQYVF